MRVRVKERDEVNNRRGAAASRLQACIRASSHEMRRSHSENKGRTAADPRRTRDRRSLSSRGTEKLSCFGDCAHMAGVPCSSKTPSDKLGRAKLAESETLMRAKTSVRVCETRAVLLVRCERLGPVERDASCKERMPAVQASKTCSTDVYISCQAIRQDVSNCYTLDT